MSVYCIFLLQFAFLHTYSLKAVNALEILQNLAKLRGIYQIMKEKFYDKSLIHLPRQDTQIVTQTLMNTGF